VSFAEDWGTIRVLQGVLVRHKKEIVDDEEELHQYSVVNKKKAERESVV